MQSLRSAFALLLCLFVVTRGRQGAAADQRVLVASSGKLATMRGDAESVAVDTNRFHLVSFDRVLTHDGGSFPSEVPVRLKHVAVGPQL